ncbi:MAG: deoxyhypusine synthase [Promethearchaeati archaeon SRVP18_Atabeyarchaeia-1]
MERKYVEQMKIRAGMSVGELVDEMGRSGVFGAGRISRAVEIYEGMISDKEVLKFMGVAGALVPGGLRKVIRDIVDEDMANIVVLTGANITHELVEAFGWKHEKGIISVGDAALREVGINRIFDAFVRDEAFEGFETRIRDCFSSIDEDRRREGLGSYELLHMIGTMLDDEESILKTAAKKGVTVFCPGIFDSILGLHIWMFSQQNELKIDLRRDLQKIMDLYFESKKVGGVFLGGGMPKNFILQAAMLTGRALSYAIQLTMDRPEPGGLSGASLQEAQSWGKVKPEAEWVDVITDVTIGFPLIVAATKEKLSRRREEFKEFG